MDDISGNYNKLRVEVGNTDILTTNSLTLIDNKVKIEDISPSKVMYVCKRIINAVISILSFITPLKLRFKTSPVIDASNMGNGFYLPCLLNKHIKSTRSSVTELAQNRINTDKIISNTEVNDSAMDSTQVKQMVTNAFEQSYETAKQKNKENFGIVINIPGKSKYPTPTDNQLSYDEFIKLFYTEAHNQLNLFQALDSSINFHLYVNFPKETDSKQTNLAINQTNASYDSIPDDVYVSNIKQYIQSYQKICERSVREAEGCSIVSGSQIEIDQMLPQDTINNSDIIEVSDVEEYTGIAGVNDIAATSVTIEDNDTTEDSEIEEDSEDEEDNYTTAVSDIEEYSEAKEELETEEYIGVIEASSTTNINGIAKASGIIENNNTTAVDGAIESRRIAVDSEFYNSLDAPTKRLLNGLQKVSYSGGIFKDTDYFTRFQVYKGFFKKND